MALTPGTRLGPYEIVTPLGAGGMGEVYRARDPRLDREVAVKVLPADVMQEPDRLARLEREARAVASINHPNIVVLHSIEEDHGVHFLTMELVDGQGLERVVASGPLPIARVVDIGIAISDALAAAHGKGVVHRDLKPANVMLTAEGRVKVLDFGLAKLAASEPPTAVPQGATVAASLSNPGEILGTAPYMAPEQIRGEPVDARTDLFALGVLLYELAAGRRPFAGATPADLASAILRDVPSPLTSVRTGLTDGLERIVRRCLEKSPGARFQSAVEVGSELRRVKHDLEGGTVAKRRRWTPVMAAGFVLLLAAVAGVVGILRHGARIQWATASIPRIGALADSANVEGAWKLAQEIRSVLHDDPLLAPVWPRISRVVNMRTDPPGARVLRRAFAGADTTWRSLGVTPLDRLRVPLGGWYLRFEKEGFRSLEVLVAGSPAPDLDFALDDGRGSGAGMAHVSGGRMPEVNLPGLERLGGVTLEPFWIDAHEVTNGEFKRFVEAGGYRRREFWEESFILEGAPVAWEAAMARFTDRSGRPGPATWEAGDFPAGQAEHPVGGVSWYEAAAYAKYAGKSLPTVFHWVQAARTTASAFIVPRSNFEGSGPAPVGSFAGIGPYGTFDMAGNVREWCFNAAGNARYILGGGWNDPGYAFSDAYAQPAFDRSPSNGFRLALFRAPDTTLASLRRPILGATRDFSRERPASDDLFAVYLRQYDYDRTPLDEMIETRDTTAQDFILERVSFDAAYGGERVTAYLFLPRRVRPPYQTVVFFPGSNALTMRTFDAETFLRQVDFMIKSGRAVMLPVYKSTFERGDGFETDLADESNLYRDHVIMYAKDFRRSVDYLESRPDIDARRLAYYGYSWGGVMGGIIPVVEPRIRTVILCVVGLAQQRALPEVDPIHFLPRVRVPVLMLNGRFDHYFPVESSQQPFFRLLGTRPPDKRLVIADGGHFVPRNQLIGESLDWLDRHLGPVR
jgi:dienelactone hydrolase